jgi:DNA-binding XRE family transcriptional regulator
MSDVLPELNAHPESSGSGILENLGEMLAQASGEAPPSRETLFDGHVLVEERRRGEVVWSLADAPADLPKGVVSRTHVDAAALRSHFRQTQEGMAELLGVPLRTYQKWEQGTREYPAATLKLLRVAASAPTVLLEEEKLLAA